MLALPPQPLQIPRPPPAPQPSQHRQKKVTHPIHPTIFCTSTPLSYPSFALACFRIKIDTPHAHHPTTYLKLCLCLRVDVRLFLKIREFISLSLRRSNSLKFGLTTPIRDAHRRMRVRNGNKHLCDLWGELSRETSEKLLTCVRPIRHRRAKTQRILTIIIWL